MRQQTVKLHYVDCNKTENSVRLKKYLHSNLVDQSFYSILLMLRLSLSQGLASVGLHTQQLTR